MLGTAKLYESYNMTNLGANQVYNSGDFYRRRYLVDGVADQIAGISPEIVNASQLYASAPDQDVRSRRNYSYLVAEMLITRTDTLADCQSLSSRLVSAPQ